jgi:hypothetical protein
MVWAAVTYGMLPRRRPGGDVAARGIPLDVGYAVVVGSVHDLQARCHVLLRLRLLALKVEVEEIEVRALGVGDCGQDDESALR